MPDDPSDPMPPDDDLQRLVEAISDLKVEIVEHVSRSVKRYMRDKNLASSARFDRDLLKVAAQAYREVAGIPVKIREREPAPAY